MNSAERVKTLLNKEIPDMMGLYEHYWPETLNEYWPKQGYPKGTLPEMYFNYDLIGCGGWFNSIPFQDRNEIVEETEEWRVTIDGRGAKLKLWKNKSGTPEHIDFEVTSPEKWKKYREPLLETDMKRLGDIQLIRNNMETARKEGKYILFGNLFIFELMRATMGDQNFLPALLLEREWIHDFCSVYLDMYKRHYDILFRETGVPDGFFIYEDFGYRNGLFCSPQTYKEMVFPYTTQLVSFLHDYGIQVLLHSCGDIRKVIPQVIDAGFDCLQPMEAKAGCDVLEIARTYGRKISYMGNINVVALNTNDRDTIKNEIVPKLRALKKLQMPYFFHSDHSIPPTVNLETYRYALELFRDNARY